MKIRLTLGLVVLAATVLTGCSTEHVSNLKPGDCFNLDIGGGYQEISTVPTVDCSEEHSAEVFYVTDLSSSVASSYDEEEIAYAGWEECIEAFEGYTGADFWSAEAADIDLDFFFPLEKDWNSGDRNIMCVILPLDPTQTLTGSLKGAYAAG